MSKKSSFTLFIGTQSLSRTRVDKIATIPINEVLAHIIQGLTIWRLNGT